MRNGFVEQAKRQAAKNTEEKYRKKFEELENRLARLESYLILQATEEESRRSNENGCIN